MWFEFASSQIQGKRAAQEDSIEVLLPDDGRDHAPGCAERLTVALADGMGGHVGGRIASGIVARKFLEALKEHGIGAGQMAEALSSANAALKVATEKRPELDGMGSTLVGATVEADGVAWISIGDSGLFLIREGHIVRLNEDHSFGAYLDDQAAKGLIPPELASSDRRRNQLFHALLGDPIDHYEHRPEPRQLQPGDVLVFASDGLKTLEDSAVGSIIAHNSDLPAADLADMLLRSVEAENKPRQDNATVLVVRVRDGAMPEAPTISRIVGPFMPGSSSPFTRAAAAEGDVATAEIAPDVAPPDFAERASGIGADPALRSAPVEGPLSRRAALLALFVMAVGATAAVGLIAWLL